MTASQSFTDLTRQLAGENREEVARMIFDRFSNRLIGLARSRLRGPLRHKVDPESVVQSAYRSFFRGSDSDQFAYDTWESLWGLLTLLTLRKCYARVDYYLAERRDVNREVPVNSRINDTEPDIELAAADPSAAEAAMLVDLVEQLMAGLTDREQEIASLLLQQYSIREISDGVKLSERTVSRIRDRIRDRLELLLADDASRPRTREPQTI